mmetsp:Transcript_7420/g.13345  ORF Transcript_7420/g.13345 Transcript_7420/m.13345 type:complete len:284 (+) Transcript_7420:1386-2237(+)
MGDGGEVCHQTKPSKGLTQRCPPGLWRMILLLRHGPTIHRRRRWRRRWPGDQSLFHPLGIPHDRIRTEFGEVLRRFHHRLGHPRPRELRRGRRRRLPSRRTIIIIVQKEQIGKQLAQPLFTDGRTPPCTPLIHQDDPFERLPVHVGYVPEQCGRGPARCCRCEGQSADGGGTSESWASLEVEHHARGVDGSGSCVRIILSTFALLLLLLLQIQFGTLPRRKSQIGKRCSEFLMGGVGYKFHDCEVNVNSGPAFEGFIAVVGTIHTIEGDNRFIVVGRRCSCRF